jgi:Na+-translocating ferredoxin:NAD+ oxidoreductase RnfG subunit
MIKSLLFLFFFSLVSAAFTIPEKLSKKADKVITKFYEIEDFTKGAIAVSEVVNSETQSEFGDENLFSILANEKLLGYGYIGNAPSKTATFDYLVLFDAQFNITKSKVLIYREEYGGEIGSMRWLRQFTGKSPASSELRYNEDIIPISGATISVRSMTRAINELLQSIGKLQELKVL